MHLIPADTRARYRNPLDVLDPGEGGKPVGVVPTGLAIEE